MSFLAPWFLLGALAVVGPVFFHLIRRTIRDRVPFSSLMFLQPTPPKLTQRRRIEHWLLLVLRALALGLLALAFARPFWKSPAAPAPAAAAGGRTLVLLDVSASLRRDGLWAAARENARAAIREAGGSHDLAVMAFDRSARPVLTFDEWRSMAPADRVAGALARVDALEPGWHGTDLASALAAAAEALVDGDGGGAAAVRRLVLVSDLQEGSRLDGIQSFSWPKGVETVLAPVVCERAGNAGLQTAAGKAANGGGGEGGARLRVSNAADSPGEAFQVGWADESGEGFASTALDVVVPPGQSRLVTVPWPSGKPQAGRLRLSGDSHGFDNLLATAPPPQTRVRVVHLGYDAAADPLRPLFFLQKALPQSERLATDVTTVAPEGPVPPPLLAGAGLVVITEPVAPAVAAAVRARMEAGLTALIVLNGTEMAGALSALAGGGSIPLEEATPGTYAMLGEIDFRHPLFAPFADPRFSDFTKIRFQRYRVLKPEALPGARVPARFDSGDPAVLESDVGRGRLVVLTSGWVAADSQLAVSSKFPTLLGSLLEWTGASTLAAASFVVGEPVSRLALGVPEGVPVSVRTPAGATVQVAADAPSFVATLAPGMYMASAGGEAARAVPVTLDPMESRTTPLTGDDFERLGVPLARAATAAHELATGAALSPAAETENRQKMWRWFLMAALAVLVLETALAGRAARRPSTSSEAVP